MGVINGDTRSLDYSSHGFIYGLYGVMLGEWFRGMTLESQPWNC